MEKRILGRTGLEVSPIGFGGMELTHLDEKQACHLINEAIDNGVNYIDTSPEYFSSEEFIGKAIGHRRKDYILATKCGDNLHGDVPFRIWTRENLIENLDNSLKLMKTDYIDLWQIHGVTPEYFPESVKEEVLTTLVDMKKAGKVRFIGATFRNGQPEDALFPDRYSLVAAREFINWPELDTLQFVYGGLTRKAENAISKAGEKGIGVIARGVVKKYTPEYDELFEKSRIAELFEEGETRNGFLIRYAISHPAINTIIVGTKNVNHMLENIKIVKGGKLSEDTYKEAKRRLDSVGVIAEEF